MKHYMHSPYIHGYGLDDPVLGFWQRKHISLIHIVQAGSGAHPASYSISTGVFSIWQSGRDVS
jgi:hypothetical protein